MKGILVFLLLSILAAGLVLFWYLAATSAVEAPVTPETLAPSKESVSGNTANTVTGVSEPEGQDTPGKQQEASRAVTGSAGPDKSATDPGWPAPAEQADPLKPASREEALNTGRLLQRCSGGFWSEATILRTLAERDSQVNWHNWSITIRGENMRFESLEEYESYLWSLHDRCAEIQQSQTASGRHELLLAAEGGDVFARFLYAMWAPEHSYDQLGDLIEYQERALEFSWRNVRAGEPLGMLALGLSYARRGASSLFTPSNRILSNVFMLAAAKCGLASEWFDSEVSNIIDGLDRPGAPVAELELLNQSSDEIAASYCG